MKNFLCLFLFSILLSSCANAVTPVALQESPIQLTPTPPEAPGPELANSCFGQEVKVNAEFSQKDQNPANPAIKGRTMDQALKDAIEYRASGLTGYTPWLPNEPQEGDAGSLNYFGVFTGFREVDLNGRFPGAQPGDKGVCVFLHDQLGNDYNGLIAIQVGGEFQIATSYRMLWTDDTGGQVYLDIDSMKKLEEQLQSQVGGAFGLGVITKWDKLANMGNNLYRPDAINYWPTDSYFRRATQSYEDGTNTGYDVSLADGDYAYLLKYFSFYVKPKP